MWEDGRIVVNGEVYYYEAKVYDKPSKHGIRNGRVSKLVVWKPKDVPDDAVYTARSILSYSREWIEPGSEPQKNTFQYDVLETVLAAIKLNHQEWKDNE